MAEPVRPPRPAGSVSRASSNASATGILSGLRALFVPARKSNLLGWAIAAAMVGALFRIAVFAWTIHAPIINETGDPVSPTSLQKGADYSFYRDSQRMYAGDSGEILDTIIKSLDYEMIILRITTTYENIYEYVLSGPVFPILFHLFQYGEGNTLPLSLFSLILGIITVSIWCRYILNFGLPVIWAFGLALLPNAVWYQLNNSADHFLFFFFTLFFTVYFSEMAERKRIILATLIAVLMCLTKPNALPVLAFLVLDQVFNRQGPGFELGRRLFLIVMLALCAVGAVFYAGYFAAVMQSTLGFSFYGIPHGDYISGLFSSLPEVLDKPLSWLTLLGVKLLHFVGLRPSWGITPGNLVLLRAAPGLILLPGIIWLFWRGDRRVALLVGLYMVPPFIGPTQERYNLPIHPILFAYGALAITSGLMALQRRIAGPLPTSLDRAAENTARTDPPPDQPTDETTNERAVRIGSSSR